MELEELMVDNKTEREEGFYGGIGTGIVKENWNENAKGMVLVEMTLGEEGKTDTAWIPVMQPYCGNGFGQYFLPEIGSQVVLGFQGGDINCPVVLGCLWNEVDLLPAETAKEGNTMKKIQTKGGNRIELDDTQNEEQIGFYTKNGISVELQDKAKLVRIKDQNAKTMIEADMDKGEIRLRGETKIILSAGGKDALTIDGQTKKITLEGDMIEIKSAKNLQMKGQNMKLDGGMLELKAQGSLKAGSSGIMELKGTMVKIN